MKSWRDAELRDRVGVLSAMRTQSNVSASRRCVRQGGFSPARRATRTPCWHPGLEVAASTTVSNEGLFFQPSSV